MLLSCSALLGCPRGPTLPSALSVDPALAAMPLGTHFVQHVDLRRLRESPAYPALAAELGALGETLAPGACTTPVHETLSALTFGYSLGGEPVLVFRTASASVANACIDAWTTAVLGAEPEAAATVGPLHLRGGSDEVAAVRAVLAGEARSLESDARYAPLRERIRDAGLVVLLDLDAFPVAELEPPRVLGIDRGRMQGLLEATQVASLVLDAPSTGGLVFGASTVLDAPGHATDFADMAATSWSRNLPFARAAVLAAPAAIGVEEFESGDLITLAGAIDTVHIEAHDRTVTVDARLDGAQLDVATQLLRAGLDRHRRRLLTEEAIETVHRIAEGLRAYAQTHEVPAGQRRFPPGSAPLPAEVPRGTVLELPEAIWAGSPYREIGEAPPTRVRFQYSVLTTRSGFRVTARGDLDGDGDLSEFTVVGTVLADGAILLSPLEIQQELE